MTSRILFSHNRNRRRGVVVVQVAVTMTALLGMAALTIDIGSLYNARGDLQAAADAAALAGASAYTGDNMMRVRMGDDIISVVTDMASSRVSDYAAINPTFGLSTTLVDSGDISAGWINMLSGTDPIQTGSASAAFNAVQVTLRRETTAGGNGAVPLFFAPIFGQLLGETSASAVAVYDDRFAGYSTSAPGPKILPMTMHEDAFASELASGGDSYSYDNNGDVVSNGADGIREIRLYPYPLSGSGYAEGDGNFGILNIGTGNQGVSAEEVQILNGVPPSDFELEIGTSDLTFFDADVGESTTYDITGSPGLEASLKTALSSLVGEVVGFMLHDNVVLSGANATYRMTEMRFARVMAVKLTGQPSQRGVFLQPVSYSGGGVHVDPSAPSSNGLVGLIVIAR